MRKLFLTATICIAVYSAQAQKVGYVNTQELIQSIPDVKEANSNIETYRTQFQKRGQDMLKNLQAKYMELEKKHQRGEISPKQLEEQGTQLKKEEQDILKFEQESQQKILKKSEDLLKPLRDKIQNAIDQVASEQGFEYIFDHSTGFVLYADESADVSSAVRAKLGL